VTDLVRFGIAMERPLLERLDALVDQRGSSNRSEIIRDLVRRELDQDAWAQGGVVSATITLAYDHHVRELTAHLNEIQHDHGDHIISTLHVHLDRHHCMEVIATRGPSGRLKEMSERLLGTKGVLTGGIVPVAVPVHAT
jgi:CopG family transcriptional regulator, nickel-responsive regulator